MILYFARHGESEANLLKIISNRPGRHGLTGLGREQAGRLAAALAGRISAVYTSPLLRARQTAEITADALKLGFTEADALREYDCGELEGRSDAAAWEAHGRCFSEWMQLVNWDCKPPGGESPQDMRRRFVPFIERLSGAFRGSEAGILLIGHGGTFRLMLPLVLANVDHAFANEHPIGNTGFVAAEERNSGLVCLEWCGTVPAAG